MTTRATPTGTALLALIGPMIWAAHFFAVYLVEAVLCSPAVSANSAVHVAGVGLTIGALVALLSVRRISKQGAWTAFARPLIDLSIVAVVLTAIPFVMIASCASSGA